MSLEVFRNLHALRELPNLRRRLEDAVEPERAARFEAEPATVIEGEQVALVGVAKRREVAQGLQHGPRLHRVLAAGDVAVGEDDDVVPCQEDNEAAGRSLRRLNREVGMARCGERAAVERGFEEDAEALAHPDSKLEGAVFPGGAGTVPTSD